MLAPALESGFPQGLSGYCDGSIGFPSESLLEYLPLVDTIVHGDFKHVPSYIDRSDMIQDGTVGLLEAARTYNPDYGVPFPSWARTKIRSGVYDGLRRMDSRRLEWEEDEVFATSEELVANLPWEELTDREYWVVYLSYLEGFELSEVAMTMGITDNQVKWARQVALQKLRG
jgi:RNA polymerase sigma factor (sigma-70 family)